MSTTQYPLFAVIDESTSGNNTLVSAVAGYRIRVLSYDFVVNGEVSVRFESGADGTALSGVMPFASKGQGKISVYTGSHGVFETAAGELLNMELSAAVQVSGHLTYTLIEAGS